MDCKLSMALVLLIFTVVMQQSKLVVTEGCKGTRLSENGRQVRLAPTDYTCIGLENCDVKAQETACELLLHHDRGRIILKSDHYDPQGNYPTYDGASVLSNVFDYCQGRRVRRSSYCSSSLGGCTCLKYEMLASLRDYAINFYSKYHQAIRVTALAGSCIGPNSTHYEGRAFAVGCKYPRDHCDELVEWCRSQSSIEPCYPGGGNCITPIPKEAGNWTWVSCTF